MEKLKALIAEDEPLVARFIQRILEEDGWEVLAACETGEQALAVIRLTRVDALISDIRMPGMDGLELIQRARVLAPEIGAVIISGYKDFEYARRAIQLEVENYITKPIDRGELRRTLAAIRSSLEGRRLYKRRQMLQAALRNNDGKRVAEAFPWPRFQMMMIWTGLDRVDRTFAALSENPKCTVVFYRNSIAVLQGMSPGQEDVPVPWEECARLAIRANDEAATCVCLAFRRSGMTSGMKQILREGYETLLHMTVLERRELRFAADFSTPAGKHAMPIERRLDAATAGMTAEEYVGKLVEAWRDRDACVYDIRSQMYILSESADGERRDSGEANNRRYQLEEALQNADTYEQLKAGLIRLFAEHLAWRGGEAQGDQEARQLFVSITRLVEREEGRCYTLQEISNLYGRSCPFIRKVFRMYAGMSYNEYVIQQKMKLARTLMRYNPSMRIKAVAESIGMEQLYFCTVFKKYNGITPSQYRAEVLNNPPPESPEG